MENLERIPPVYFFTPDIEREINKLDGVTSCRVLSTGAEIEEIHVIAPPDRVPKKLVRNIESLLLVHFGIRIDHRKVSVVQMGQEPILPRSPTRPNIFRIERRPTEAGEDICIEVRAAERLVEGIGRQRPGESELWGSSRALINAIEKLLDTQGALELQDVTTVRASNQEIVLAVVSWASGGQTEMLVGASVARADPLEAAARATFDALNRRLIRARPAHGAA